MGDYQSKGGEKNNMNFKSRFVTAIATGAVLVSALAPLANADTVTVSGNGALSGSVVNVSNSSNTVVNQTNNANISNNINTNASTGGNSSDYNTGGNSTIKSGNATTNVTVNNAANLNQATVSCGCDNSGVDVNVTGNGAKSENGVNVNNANQVFLDQNNNANYKNNVTANATTGKNDQSFNTGGSNVLVSGDASTNVSVNNAANANVANIGGGSVGSSDPSSVVISGNGALSANGVNLNNESAVVLDQANDAQINNNVKANAKTGDNSQDFNTGGSNGLRSGNATDDVNVNNFANFNAAAISCDCTLSDLGVKVAGNGAESENGVNSSTSNSVFPNQINDEGLWNGVDGGAKTGGNDLGFSTGSVYGDPVVISGDSSSSTNVNNVGNANVLNGSSVSLPGGVSLGMNFDLNGLWAFFNGLQ